MQKMKLKYSCIYAIHCNALKNQLRKKKAVVEVEVSNFEADFYRNKGTEAKDH